MKSNARQLLAAAGLLASCGGTPGLTPTLSIASPSDNSTVNVAVSSMVAVNFSTNYTLRTPGGCAGHDPCGFVYVLVDSSTCNQPSLPYNALAVSSPVQADLGRCPTIPGMHTITLELRHDDGVVVEDLFRNPVTAKVTITAQSQ